MKNFINSPKTLFIIATSVVILSNLIILFNVYQNQSNPADSIVTLTQRELTSYNYYKNQQDRYFVVNWKNSNIYNRYDSLKWLDNQKLIELGFDIQKALKFDKHREVREVFVVLEVDSPLHQKFVEKKKLEFQRSIIDANQVYINSAKNNLKSSIDGDSRLYLLDANINYEELRKKYSDRSRYIIQKAQIKIYRTYDKNKVYYIVGYISTISIPHIHISLENSIIINNILKNATKDKKYKYYPKYKVKVAFGSRLEPYIIDIKAIKYK